MPAGSGNTYMSKLKKQVKSKKSSMTSDALKNNNHRLMDPPPTAEEV